MAAIIESRKAVIMDVDEHAHKIIETIVYKYQGNNRYSVRYKLPNGYEATNYDIILIFWRIYARCKNQ